MEIIDSHTHWGPSVTLFMTVTTKELLRQAQLCGVDRVVIFPFPSKALDDEAINEDILKESMRVDKFIHKIGPERIIFGSDIPFGTMKNELNKIESLNIGSNYKELILAKNLKRIIGL